MQAGRVSRIGWRMVIATIVGATMLWPGASAADSATLPPVLLVHGFRGSPAAFDAMAARLARGGRVVYAIALPGQDNLVNAKAIRTFAAAHHLRRVDIVAHSM